MIFLFIVQGVEASYQGARAHAEPHAWLSTEEALPWIGPVESRQARDARFHLGALQSGQG